MDKIQKVFIFQPHKKKGNLTWYGLIKEGGTIIRRLSLKTTLKRDADLWKKQEAGKQFLPTALRSYPTKEVSLKEAIEEHLSLLRSIYGNSPSTFAAYRNYLNKFNNRFKTKPLRTIDLKESQAFLNALVDKYAPKTVDEIFKFCKKMFKRWVAYKHISQNPFEHDDILLPKIIRNERPFWLPEEISLILGKYATSENRAFWASMAYVGLRFGEAHSLIFEKIDFERNQITINGKGNKIRIIPMNTYLRNILLEELDRYKSGRCFPMVAETESGCIKELKRCLHMVPFTIFGPITLHRFRHSFASNLLRKKANIKDVQALMGHSDIAVTLNIYGHIISADLTQTVNLL